MTPDFSRPSDRAQWEIRNVIASAAHLSDDGDLDRYMSTFTPDARWELDGEVVQGREAITIASARRRAMGVTGPGSGTLHLVSTFEVEVISAERACARSCFQFVGRRGQEIVVLLCGTYLDSFVHTPEGWRITDRVLRTI